MSNPVSLDNFRAEYTIDESDVIVGPASVIFVALQPTLNRHVAIKFLRSTSQSDFDRFERERELLARFSDNGVVPVYDSGTLTEPIVWNEQEFFHFFVMPHRKEGSLQTRLDELGFYQPREAAALVAETAEVLSAVHEEGIIHRDVKPSNILLVNDSPELADFGIVKDQRATHPITRQTTRAQLLGTPVYMAPEQFGDEDTPSDVDNRSDIYSLGVTTYQLLTNEVPYHGTPYIIKDQKQELPPSPQLVNEDVPRDLAAICCKAMHPDRSRRYDTATAFADDLRRYLHGEPTVARPITNTERLGRWCRKNPFPAGLLVAVLMVVAIGGGLVSWQWRRAEANAVQMGINAEDAKASAIQAGISAAEAQASATRADESARQAAYSFAQAHEAVRDMVALAGDPRLDVPGSEPTKHALLERALEHELQFLEQQKDDKLLLREVAEAFLLVGLANQELGKQPEAIAALKESLVKWEELPTLETNDRIRQAQTYTTLAVVQHDSEDEAAKAKDTAKQAVDILRDVLDEAPNNTVKSQLARALLNYDFVFESNVSNSYLSEAKQLVREVIDAGGGTADIRARYAIILTSLGTTQTKPELMMKHFEEGLQLRERLVQEFPESRTFRKDRAHSYHRIAHIHFLLKKYSEAITWYEKARDERQQLVNQSPAVPRYAMDLGHTYSEMGGVYTQWGKLQEDKLQKAEECYNSAVGIQKPLADEYPKNIAYQRSYASACNNFAGWLYTKKRFAEARQHLEGACTAYDRLASIRQDYLPRRFIAHENLAEVCNKLDDTKAVVAQLELCCHILTALKEKYPERPEYAAKLTRYQRSLTSAKARGH